MGPTQHDYSAIVSRNNAIANVCKPLADYLWLHGIMDPVRANVQGGTTFTERDALWTIAEILGKGLSWMNDHQLGLLRYAAHEYRTQNPSGKVGMPAVLEDGEA